MHFFETVLLSLQKKVESFTRIFLRLVKYSILVDPRNWIMIVSIHCLHWWTKNDDSFVPTIVPTKMATLNFLSCQPWDFFVQTTSKDSVLPLIPFAFWLLLLCWLWSSTTSTAHLTSAKLSKLTVAENPPTSKGVEVKLEDFESEFSI